MLSLANPPVVSLPSRGLFTEAWVQMSCLPADVQCFLGSDLEAGVIRHELLELLLCPAR